MPNISRTNLRTILHKSKVYLHTSENEPFGVSIIEAMSSGCIPIVPNCGGPQEFVPKGLRYENVDEAAQLVELAVSEWSLFKARQFIEVSQRFSEERFSKELLGIIKL